MECDRRGAQTRGFTARLAPPLPRKIAIEIRAMSRGMPRPGVDRMTTKLSDDCFVHDMKRLRHGEALAILKQRLVPVAGKETVPLAQAAGRILAEPAVASRPVPALTNAAVDGYSFAAR